MLTEAQAKIDLGKKFLLRNECYFATCLMGLTQKPDEDPDGTMATNGTELFWSAPFVVASDQAKVLFVLLHETLHVILKHHLRRGPRDPRLWNIAADMVINWMIVRMGLPANYNDVPLDTWRNMTREQVMSYVERDEYRMPEDGLFDPKYAGYTTEEVYTMLEQEEQSGDDTSDDGDGDGDGDGKGKKFKQCPWGNVEDATGEDGAPLTPEEIREAEKMVDQAMKTAEQVAKGRGQMPGWLSEAIATLTAPSVDWRDALEEMLTETIPVDINFNRPNRFYIGGPVVMPSVAREGVGHVGVFIDESGSMSTPEHAQAMSEAFDIVENLQPDEVTIIRFEYKAGEPEVYEHGDEIELTRKMNGGTRFAAPFEKAEECGLLDEFDVIIVFTDGGDNSYADEPPCPVIWASTGAFYGGNPPYGRCLPVKFNR